MAMTSHELARVLLDNPDLPVATHALNTTWFAKDTYDRLRVSVLETYVGQFIVIGDMSKRMLNPPNWWISETLLGDLPDSWGHSDKPYAGHTTADVDFYAKDMRRLELHGDGIDRFNTGMIGTRSAQVDARGPDGPQFGGKWAGRAWDENKTIAETGWVHDSFPDALAALNVLLEKHDLVVLAPRHMRDK